MCLGLAEREIPSCKGGRLTGVWPSQGFVVLCLVGFVWWPVNDLSQRGCQLWGDWLLVDKVCDDVGDCGLLFDESG